MNRLSKIAALGLCVLASLQGADAQVTKQGNGYLLRMKFAPGQTAKYNTNIDVNAGAGQKMAMSMPMTQKVTTVKNGVADITMTVGPVAMNGKPMSQQTQSVQISMDSSGKVVKGAPGQTGPQVALPAKAVKVGESWTVNTKTQAGMMGVMDVKATYTLLGLKSVRGQQVAELAVRMSAAGQAKMNGNGTMTLRQGDGSLQDATIKMNMSMPAAQGGKPQTIVMTMAVKRA